MTVEQQRVLTEMRGQLVPYGAQMNDRLMYSFGQPMVVVEIAFAFAPSGEPGKPLTLTKVILPNGLTI